MRLPLLESRLARRDLASIEDRIAKDNPAAAFRFVRAVRLTYSRIGRWPESGRLTVPPDCRMMPVGGFSDYVVIWKVREDHVAICRVFHGHLDHLRVMGDSTS